MMQPVIQAQGISKVFHDFWWRPKVKAVNEISFEVQPGEIFGLLGPNGSGKSTTLKMLLGLLHPTKGQLTVFDQSPKKVKTKTRIGYLPEESYSYPYLTSEETLDFYGRLFNLPGDERKRRINELLDMTGMNHARKRQVGEFSKGMARRIGLAQALINDPDLIILDEPTSGLDPLGCRQVKDLIIALAERGKTVLLSSHLLADVEDVCDRIAILYNGQIQASGPIKQLLEERNQHRLTFTDLDPDQLKQVLEKIREEFSLDPDVDHPQKNLEQYFLQVIEKARQGTLAQTGVEPVQKLASYLSHGDTTASREDG